MERISVFSNYLVDAGLSTEEEILKPSTVYDRLRNAYNQGAEGLALCKRIFLPPEDEDFEHFEELFCKMLFSDKELTSLIKWVNIKIVFPLNILTYQTVGVRMRIATGMLNKMVAEKRIPENLGMFMHYYLVSNLNREFFAIGAEDLPF